MSLFHAYFKLKSLAEKQCLQKYQYKQVKEVRDIVYSPALPKVCRLDVIKKESKTELPTILYIHGGSFVSGSKSARRNYCRYMANAGFAVVNIDYGLAPEFLFPEPIMHAQQALKWIEFNATKYGLDLDNLVVAGDSAGAYIAMALYLSCTNAEYRKQTSNINTFVDIKGLVFHCGIFDPEKLLAARLPLNAAFWLAQQVFNYNAALGAEKTPYYSYINVRKLVSENCVPTFISYTEYDIHRAPQSAQMVDQMRKKGIPIWEFKAIEHHAKHNWQIVKNDNYGTACLEAVTQFLNALQASKNTNKYIEV